MALERKPVEESRDPGYPSTNEYVTGRRAFIGLLGLTALGAGGAYALRARPEVTTGGTPLSPPIVAPDPQPVVRPEVAVGGAPPVPEAVPQADAPGKIAPPEPALPEVPAEGLQKPVRPQAQLRGDVMAPEPLARPETAISGDVALPEMPVVKPPEQPNPEPLVQPGANLRGRVRSVQPPAQPKAAVGGAPPVPKEPDASENPKPPAEPQAEILGFCRGASSEE